MRFILRVPSAFLFFLSIASIFISLTTLPGLPPMSFFGESIATCLIVVVTFDNCRKKIRKFMIVAECFIWLLIFGAVVYADSKIQPKMWTNSNWPEQFRLFNHHLEEALYNPIISVNAYISTKMISLPLWIVAFFSFRLWMDGKDWRKFWGRRTSD